MQKTAQQKDARIQPEFLCPTFPGRVVCLVMEEMLSPHLTVQDAKAGKIKMDIESIF